MGLSIDRTDFSAAEFDAFSERLSECLTALRTLLNRPGFGEGPTTIGAELEISIVNDDGAALPLNREVFRTANESHLQLEIDRFNLEYNLDPVSLAGSPMSHLRDQLQTALATLNRVAAPFGGRPVPVGILPTLKEADLQPDALTALPRYQALANGIRRLRGAPFEIEINGHESLNTRCESVTLEGANTSFQLHLRVSPDEFAQSFNAAQMVAPLALAVGANSPVFLEHLLWDETRIALFKQAIDSRTPDRKEWRRAARVPFGHGWVRQGALELFAESVALFPPLIPVMSDEAPGTVLATQETPGLWELRLHQGTIWQWNRAIFDPADSGHLRIELRALPAGPTVDDMVANAAFFFGLILGMRDDIDILLPAFPFHYAEYNFYRAAQDGLDAELLWPDTGYPSPTTRRVRDLVLEMLPVATRGLAAGGVEQHEVKQFLELIRRRAETGNTGARWQRRKVQEFDEKYSRPDALKKMLDRYMRGATDGQPVSEWPH